MPGRSRPKVIASAARARTSPWLPAIGPWRPPPGARAAAGQQTCLTSLGRQALRRWSARGGQLFPRGVVVKQLFHRQRAFRIELVLGWHLVVEQQVQAELLASEQQAERRKRAAMPLA